MGSQQENAWKCSKCSKIFRTQRLLSNHTITHDPEAKVKCQICGKISKTPNTFSSHMSRIHKNRKRLSCDICHRVCCSPSTLRKHIETVHNSMKRTRFPCGFPGCGKTYLHKGGLSNHMKTEHLENPARFPCTLCGKEFKTRQVLENHISTHTTEKAYTCSTCGRSFGRCMKSHEATHLEKSARRIFVCELCPQTSFNRTDLQKHIRVVHEKQRNHPCTFCEKKFSTSSDVRRHAEARHPPNAEKMHSCDKCKYRSHSRVNLADHARRHNPANRRECYFCKKQFVSFSELVGHCRRHTMEL